MLTAEEIQVVKDNARNIRFKIMGDWEAPMGWKGKL